MGICQWILYGEERFLYKQQIYNKKNKKNNNNSNNNNKNNTNKVKNNNNNEITRKLK